MRLSSVIIRKITLNNLQFNTACPHSQYLVPIRAVSTKTENESSLKFETVFTFPTVKYIATLNRMKAYHIFGTGLAVPGCGILESINVIPSGTFLAASYIGITGAVLLSLASLPFRNAIGFLYISEDNRYVKISAVDFWGRRQDRTVPANDWMPLLDMAPRTLDAIYLTPRLTDGTKYKLFLKFGNIINARKMGQVLE